MKTKRKNPKHFKKTTKFLKAHKRALLAAIIIFLACSALCMAIIILLQPKYSESFIEEYEDIEYETIEIEDEQLTSGEQTVDQEGEKGLKKIQ